MRVTIKESHSHTPVDDSFSPHFFFKEFSAMVNLVPKILLFFLGQTLFKLVSIAFTMSETLSRCCGKYRL